MSAGLTATLQFLAKTENEAALDVLIAALDCPHKPTRHGALRAVLERRNSEGHRAVFQRLASMDEQSQAIINERPERLVGAVSDALQDPSPKACASACHAITSLRLYAALPALVSVLVDTENPHPAVVAQTILKLSESFYAELSGAVEQPKAKQQDTVRERITAGLETAVRKYHRHRRREVIEAFLLICKSKNVTLRQMLQRPGETSHQPIVEALSKSPQGGVIRLLLSFLEDPQMPNLVARIVSRRSDLRFLDHLLRTISPKPSKTIAETLARFDSIAWAQPGHEVFDKLDDEAQEGAVQLLMACSIDRQEVLKVIGHLLTEGKPGGRRAAAKALAEFDGPEVDRLIVRALADEDPQVRAALIVQLRPRRIPAALSLLIRLMDNPPKEVKQALRQAMPEFTFRQFLANFDKMPEHLQPISGHLVRNIDPEILEKVVASMNGRSPVGRRRAVAAASAMGLVPAAEQTIVKLLSDDDHMVRAAAAKSLADATSMPTWEALRDALLDRSVVVQEAAEKSLEQISRSLLLDIEPAEQEEGARKEEEQQPEKVA